MIPLAIAIGLQERMGGLLLLLQWFILDGLEFSLLFYFSNIIKIMIVHVNLKSFNV